jgi:hypothetical protein
LATVAVAAAVLVFRFLRLKPVLPEPFGKGQVRETRAEDAARSGMLLLLGAAAWIIGLMAGSFFIPGEVLFTIIFGLMAGLPMSNVLYSILILGIEVRVGGTLYSTNEEYEEDGESFLQRRISVSVPEGRHPGSPREE